MKNKKDMKNQKGVGKVKVEIPMVLDEDPNPKKKKKNQMLSLQQGWPCT